VRRLLEDADVVPSKALGQNFVVDPNTVERIVRLSGVGPGDHVVEVGPGLGSLTVALIDAGAAVTAVEIDRRLAEVLRELVPSDVRIVEADALDCDWDEVLDPGLRWRLVANLPYNVATPLVVEILERAPHIASMLIMVQREVADRLVARPKTQAFGAVSVRISYFATARIVGRIGPGVFHPRPRVDSALVAIERRPEPAVKPEVASYEEIARLVRAGFSVRRKMLRRSLAGLVDEQTILDAGIAPTARAEDLDIAEWGTLAACRRSISSRHPSSSREPSG
jgi:16S rRNA (adenine1518-N6/adenine1519-N6)-dimethyltransferase